VTVDTCGSGFDTVLAVYTGGAVGALTPVGSNDDTCAVESSVTFTATGGQVYRIAVDGRDQDTGDIALSLQPTLTVKAVTVRRKRRIDATRFFVEASGGEDAADTPRLRLESGRRRLSLDLGVENEGNFFSETKFRYTFNWTCRRRGRWSWTVSVKRGGERVSQNGSFSIPRCKRRRWYVSRRKVLRGARRDGIPAHLLRCRPVGRRRGSRAAVWRCRMVRPGFACRGSFLYRYSRVLQGRDVVERRRKPSGTVTCVR
jgi:hypothetical protein